MGRRWRYRHTLLATYTLAYFATRVEPLVVGVLVPNITAGFDVTEATVGAAMTGLWMAYALVQLPSGVLVERFGTRPVLVVALLAGGVGSLSMAVSPTITTFAIVAALLGGGVGLYYNAGVISLSDRFEGTGWAIGIHRIGAQVAGLVTPVLAALVGSWYGWRVALLLGAVATFPAALCVLWFVEAPPATQPARALRSRVDRGTVTTLVARPDVVSVTTLAGIGEFVAVVDTTFLPAFLVAYHGVDQVVAGTLFSLYFLVVSATHPLTGWLADRYAPAQVVALTMTVGAVTHGLLVVVSSAPATYALAGLAGLAMGYNVPLQSKLLDSLPERTQKQGFGLFRTAYVFVGALGGVVAGTVVDGFGWAATYGLLAGLFVVGLVVVVAGPMDDEATEPSSKRDA